MKRALLKLMLSSTATVGLVNSAQAVITYSNQANSYYAPSSQSYGSSLNESSLNQPLATSLTSLNQSLAQQAYQKEDRLASFTQRLSATATQPVFNQAANQWSSWESNRTGFSNATVNGLITARPVSSSAPVTSGFGYRYIFGRNQFHKGTDFAVPMGTTVYATGNGVVTYAGLGNGYGRYVEIDHGNGLVTRYGHLSAIYVNTGDSVAVNQQIGASGNSGRSTGPHLHYEVRQNGEAVNPQTYLAMAPER